MAEDKRDYFLKIEGIDGESEDEKHPHEIRINVFNLAMSNRGNRAGYAVGRPAFDDALFVAPIDLAYPKLNQACVQNTPIPTVVLTCRKAGKTQLDFLKVTFSKVYVTNCKIDSSEATPIMEFTISFAKVQVDYREQKQNGTLGGALSSAFDLSRGRTEASS